MPDGARRRTRGALGVAIGLATLACGGAPGATAPAEAPAPAPAAAQIRGGAIPPGPVDGAWIGLAARAGGGAEPYTPTVDAALIVWHDIDALRKLSPGAAAEAATPDGPKPVRFREIASIPLGCDGNTAEVALFDGPPMEEGPVWLAPRIGQARLDPAVQTAAAEDRAEWQAGQVLITAEGEGSGGRTTVRHDGQEVWAKAWQGTLAQGGWVPEGVVRGRGARTVLFSWTSMEGIHYQAVKLGPGEPAEVGPDVYLYWCAN